jgi:putative thioredoxin
MSKPTFSFGTSFGQPAAAPAPATAPAAGASGDLIKDTTTKDFLKDVLEASKQVPVMVDFWADWCGPCKQLTPIIEKVVKAAKGKVKLVKMNIDHHPEVAGQLGIRSIPAVIAFKNGQPVDGFMGALPESQVAQFVDRLGGAGGPSEADALIDGAEVALSEGDLQGAVEMFAEAVQIEPENLKAIGGLARTYVAAKMLDQAQQILDQVPAAKAADAAISAAKAQLELARQTEKLGNAVELEARITRDPADHQARYDLAILLAARGHKEAAVDHLIEIVRRNRPWNEEAARKQLVQFFEAWGPKDDATSYGRRRLSSVLFS